LNYRDYIKQVIIYKRIKSEPKH